MRDKFYYDDVEDEDNDDNWREDKIFNGCRPDNEDETGPSFNSVIIKKNCQLVWVSTNQVKSPIEKLSSNY